MDKKDADHLFEGLYAAAGVPLTPEEKARLRAAFDPIQTLAAQVRRQGRHWEDRMLPFWLPKRKGGRP